MRGVDLRQKTFRLNSLRIGRNDDQGSCDRVTGVTGDAGK